MDDGDGGTAVWTYFMARNCTLKHGYDGQFSGNVCFTVIIIKKWQAQSCGGGKGRPGGWRGVGVAGAVPACSQTAGASPSATR